MTEHRQVDQTSPVRLSHGNLELELHPWGASLASLRFRGQELLRRIPHDHYPLSTGHFGSIAGPIANRVGGASVDIDGSRYSLEANDGPNTLHGGSRGLGRRLWSMISISERGVVFELLLRDGELGLPGYRVYRCRYEISASSELTVNLTMTSDRSTLCNLAPHPYLCLDDSGSILDHILTVYGDHYLPVNDMHLPTGEVASVEGTRFDLRTPTSLSSLAERGALSFDHNFCFSSPSSARELTKLATLYSPLSQVSLTVLSNQSGLQVYTPSSIGDPSVSDEAPDHKYPALCLEPQGWPDAPNHDHFPSVYITEDHTYNHLSIFAFSSL